MKAFYFLFGVMAAIALALWFEIRDRQEQSQEEAARPLVEKLLPGSASQVREIRWRNFELHTEEVRLRREGGDWRMLAPWKGMAETARVRALLNNATRFEKAIPFPAGDEQAAGLEAKLRGYIEFAGAFGKVHLDVGPRLYSYGDMILVRRSGYPGRADGELLRFPASLFNCINDFPEHFRRRILVPCSFEELGEIKVLTKDRGALHLRRGEAGWEAVQPFEGPLDAVAARRMASRLVTLRIDQVIFDEEPPLEVLGFEPPLAILEYGNGLDGEQRKETELELGVLEATVIEGMNAGQAQRRLARFPGSSRIFAVRENAIGALMGAWHELRSRRLNAGSSATVTQIEVAGAVRRDSGGQAAIEAAEKIVIERQGTRLVMAGGQAVSGRVATRWIEAVRALRAQAFRRRADLELDDPIGFASLRMDDGSFVSLGLYAPPREGLVAVDFGDPYLIALIDPASAALIWRGREAWSR